MADKLMAFYHSFQSAAVATGTGTAMDVGGLPAVGVQITGISGDTITFQGTIDNTNWVAVQAVNLNDGSVGTTATANGVYLVPVTGLDQLRCNITIWGAGTITVLGKGVVNAAGTSLADIDIVGQEDVNVAQMNGVATTMGAGNAGTGVQRVAVATDDINLAAINAVSGTTSGAAVVTDANGTMQQYLRGLVKLIVAQITVDVDDISKGTQTSDVKVTLDSEATNREAKAAASGHVHEPAANTAAVVTLAAAGDGVSNVLALVAWSYDGIPVAGSLIIEDVSGTTVFKVDVPESGPGFFPFNPPMKGTANGAMIITLAAGGAGISGLVSVHSWTE